MRTTIVVSGGGDSVAEKMASIGRMAGVLAIAVLVFASLYLLVLYLGSE
jgi:hypothetical protein